MRWNVADHVAVTWVTHAPLQKEIEILKRVKHENVVQYITYYNEYEVRRGLVDRRVESVRRHERIDCTARAEK